MDGIWSRKVSLPYLGMSADSDISQAYHGIDGIRSLDGTWSMDGIWPMEGIWSLDGIRSLDGTWSMDRQYVLIQGY